MQAFVLLIQRELKPLAEEAAEEVQGLAQGEEDVGAVVLADYEEGFLGFAFLPAGRIGGPEVGIEEPQGGVEGQPFAGEAVDGRELTGVGEAMGCDGGDVVLLMSAFRLTKHNLLST